MYCTCWPSGHVMYKGWNGFFSFSSSAFLRAVNNRYDSERWNCLFLELNLRLFVTLSFAPMYRAQASVFFRATANADSMEEVQAQVAEARNITIGIVAYPWKYKDLYGYKNWLILEATIVSGFNKKNRLNSIKLWVSSFLSGSRANLYPFRVLLEPVCSLV